MVSVGEMVGIDWVIAYPKAEEALFDLQAKEHDAKSGRSKFHVSVGNVNGVLVRQSTSVRLGLEA
jgi:hypothetical protein